MDATRSMYGVFGVGERTKDFDTVPLTMRVDEGSLAPDLETDTPAGTLSLGVMANSTSPEAVVLPPGLHWVKERDAGP